MLYCYCRGGDRPTYPPTYHKRNEEYRMIDRILQKITTSDSITAVFFGDSVTQGHFAAGVIDYDNVYHAVFKRKMNLYFPRKRFQVINAGVGGETSSAGLKRLDTDVLRYAPDFVVVCFGLNDVNANTKQGYADSLAAIFQKLKEHDIPTLFMTPNMLNTVVLPHAEDFAKKTADYQNSGKMDDYMQIAVQTAQEHDVPVCDCYARWKQLAAVGVDTTALLANSINHPIKEMHTLFAEALFDCIFF